MIKINLHIKWVKNSLLMLFVLFALSPCTAKELWLDLANVEYVKPLHQTKTVTQNQTCQAMESDINQSLTTPGLGLSIIAKSVTKTTAFPLVQTVEPLPQNSTATIGHTNRPKYILLKRLKIHG